MSRILCLDPAGESFGVAVLEVQDGKIYIPMHFLLNAPENWDISRKNSYMAHCTAALIGLEKPDYVVSEKPWGMGFSKDSLLQLIGAIKAESWAKIEWQGISEVRRGVLGDGHGASDKFTSTEWLLEYPFSISAKNTIKSYLDTAQKDGRVGYDILDAILHGVFFLIEKGLVQPVHKPLKIKKKKKKGIVNELHKKDS
jgi:Holliday junction resolvasome RuvABC endonuclease subunit